MNLLIHSIIFLLTIILYGDDCFSMSFHRIYRIDLVLNITKGDFIIEEN